MKDVYSAFYYSIFSWLLQLVHLHPKNRRPMVIGLNGPQGCGKSTLTAALVQLFSQENLSAITLSIDDFYFTRKEQIQLAQHFPSNPYLQQRGYPGTHDIPLGKLTLEKLKNRVYPVHIPRYDKSLYEGQGDRLPESLWNVIHDPLDIVFLEGWMLGFTPVPDTTKLNPEFFQINNFLKYYSAWTSLLDVFIHLVPLDILFTVDWRIEAEEKMKAQGKSGMTSEVIEKYIQAFLPAYSLYLPQLLAHPPVKNPYLKIALRKNRLPE